MQSLAGKSAPKRYWAYVLEYCGVEPDEVIPSRIRRIAWRYIE